MQINGNGLLHCVPVVLTVPCCPADAADATEAPVADAPGIVKARRYRVVG